MYEISSCAAGVLALFFLLFASKHKTAGYFSVNGNFLACYEKIKAIFLFPPSLSSTLSSCVIFSNRSCLRSLFAFEFFFARAPHYFRTSTSHVVTRLCTRLASSAERTPSGWLLVGGVFPCASRAQGRKQIETDCGCFVCSGESGNSGGE